MKRPTPASRKKVTPENLAALGAERLAAILASAAEGRPELKRRLRMELAAEQGAEHLAPEIDRRLASLETSRGKISWRQRPGFVRDLDALRALIAERLAPLDRSAAVPRMLALLGAARRVNGRLRDRDGALAAVFDQAASDFGRLVTEGEAGRAAHRLVEAMVLSPSAWSRWLPSLLAAAPPALAVEALHGLSARSGATTSDLPLIRQLADAAGDPMAFQATFTASQLRDPAMAAEVANRLLAADRVAEAADLLDRVRPQTPGDVDFDWETAWIETLERSDRGDEAQAARWTSFERTLSAERLRDLTRRLADFDDVEAESRAFALAARHPDAGAALRLLMAWPALSEAAQLIEARGDEIAAPAADVELWAAKLRTRQPAAAERLLRKAAAAASRRGDFATCDRLTAAADALDP